MNHFNDKSIMSFKCIPLENKSVKCKRTWVMAVIQCCRAIGVLIGVILHKAKKLIRKIYFRFNQIVILSSIWSSLCLFPEQVVLKKLKASVVYK